MDDSGIPGMNDPVRLHAALLMACLKITDGDREAAADLADHLYDTALEQIRKDFPGLLRGS